MVSFKANAKHGSSLHRNLQTNSDKLKISNEVVQKQDRGFRDGCCWEDLQTFRHFSIAEIASRLQGYRSEEYYGEIDFNFTLVTEVVLVFFRKETC